MSFILTSRTRDRQPRYPASIATEFPRPAWVTLPIPGLFLGGYPGALRNLMRPSEAAESVDAFNNFAGGDTPYGRALFNPSIGGEPTLTPNATQFNVSTDALCGATELTLLCSFWRRGAVDPSVQWMNFRTDYGHTLDVFGSSPTQITFGADWSGAWNGVSQQTVTIGDGLVTIAAVIRQDGARFFCNGVMTGTKVGGGFSIYSVGAAPYAVSISRGPRSPVLLQAAWKTALSDAHGELLTSVPWRLFGRERRPSFYGLAGGGGSPTANRIMLLRRPGLSRVWR